MMFALPLDSAANLKPHPNPNCSKPSQFHCLPKCSDLAFNLHETNLNFYWRKFMKKISILSSLVVVLCLALTSPTMAQNGTGSDSRMIQTKVASGQRMKVQGTVISRNNDTLTVRDTTGSEMSVQLAGNTKIEEKKSNPFRGSKKYSTSEVIRGLYVEVEGRGDASGALVADKIKFSTDSQRVAVSINSQVVPVENRLGTAEGRLTEAEQNAQRLSGQLEELAQVANLANGGAAAAQKTADQAMEGVSRANERISSLDDFEEKKIATINFKVGSAVLTPEAKTMLDEIATQAKSEHGFVLEVRGFASADGGTLANDRLSERRADAVVRYLAQQQQIPLRRIILPFGYGEAIPVADNTTLEGRKQNRRVEVKMLVNRGLTSAGTVSTVSRNGQDN
jgi:OmpA-OmpF porin, OOP family